jgi:hypothetical protein
MNAIKNSEINVERRAIYAAGRRKRVTYDARGELHSVRYSVTAPSKAEAVALAKEEIAYVLAAGSFEAGGCAVRCTGLRSWDFSLPGRCVMSFGAADLAAAIDYAAWSYRDHEDAQAFYAVVKARSVPRNFDGSPRETAA